MKGKTSNLKRLLSLLLACWLSLSFLVACDGGGNGDGSSSKGSDETTVAAEGKSVTLFENGAFTAELIYPADSDSEMTSLCTKLSAALRRNLGVSITVKSDSEVEANSETLEILIGETNRKESAIPSNVADGDYWYYVGMAGNKLVINGCNSTTLKLAYDLFCDNFIGTDYETWTVMDNVTLTVYYSDFFTDDWKLTCVPYYQGENVVYSSLAYDCGPTLLNMTDSTGEIEMHTVSGTTQSEFDAYIARLESMGYTVEEKNVIESNTYVTLYNGSQRVHTYFTSSRNKANVVVDPFSVSAEEFSYTVEATENEGATFYLYGLKMDPGGYNPSGKEDSYLNTSGYQNCGACLIIKLADNSLIIIDGGSSLQMKGKNGDYSLAEKYNDFLHEITGRSKDEKITVAAWFLSHTHSDHTGGFKVFLEKYGDQYDLQRVCMNIAGGDVVTTDESTTLKSIASLINKKYPNCMEMKLHTGQSIQLADVTLQVLYTHEDNIKSTGKTAISDTNDSCTVLRVATTGMSMFLWGDANTSTETIVMRTFSATTLKSDILQVAHHGFNKLNTSLKAINAPIAFFSQAEGGMHKNSGQQAIFDIIDKYSDIFYFAGEPELTVGLAYRNGQITKVYSAS